MKYWTHTVLKIKERKSLYNIFLWKLETFPASILKNKLLLLDFFLKKWLNPGEFHAIYFDHIGSSFTTLSKFTTISLPAQTDYVLISLYICMHQVPQLGVDFMLGVNLVPTFPCSIHAVTISLSFLCVAGNSVQETLCSLVLSTINGSHNISSCLFQNAHWSLEE